jgi:hypothetical protein
VTHIKRTRAAASAGKIEILREPIDVHLVGGTCWAGSARQQQHAAERQSPRRQARQIRKAFHCSGAAMGLIESNFMMPRPVGFALGNSRHTGAPAAVGTNGQDARTTNG